MIAIAFYIDHKEKCGRQIRISQWTALVDAFGVDHLAVIDMNGIECFEPKANVPVTKHKGLRDALAQFPDARVVYIDKSQTHQPYTEYQHPQGDVIYCFGCDVGGFRGDANGAGDWITIPTNSKYELWAVQAALLVMSDRWNRDNH